MSTVFFALLDRLDDGRDAVAGLDDQLHFVLGFFSFHSTDGVALGIELQHGVGDAVRRISSGTRTS